MYLHERKYTQSLIKKNLISKDFMISETKTDFMTLTVPNKITIKRKSLE